MKIKFIAPTMVGNLVVGVGDQMEVADLQAQFFIGLGKAVADTGGGGGVDESVAAASAPVIVKRKPKVAE